MSYIKCSCHECAYHHKNKDLEDGWYCSIFMKWTCSKSALYKDHSRKKKKLCQK